MLGRLMLFGACLSLLPPGAQSQDDPMVPLIQAARQRCTLYGYAEGTDIFGRCVQTLAERAASQERLREACLSASLNGEDNPTGDPGGYLGSLARCDADPAAYFRRPPSPRAQNYTCVNTVLGVQCNAN